MNHLEVKHLRMISTIAQTGNMTKAAEKLFISQSALSQQLKDIETKLMVQLFLRTKKKMLLTATGKKVLKTAQHVIETLADTELEIAKTVTGQTGELKVGTQCIFCYKWLPNVMQSFQNKFPNIEFEIGNSNHVFKELESRQFDFIITGSAVDDDQYTYLPLFEDQMVCIMPRDHPLGHKPYVDFKDFENANYISHSEKRKNKFYQLGMKPIGIEPKRFMTVGQPQAIIEMVAAGFGISLFPRWAVASSIESNTITDRPFTRTGMPVKWNAAFLKNTDITIFQKEFIHIVSRLNLCN